MTLREERVTWTTQHRPFFAEKYALVETQLCAVAAEKYCWHTDALRFPMKFNDAHEADGRFGSGGGSTGVSSLVAGLHSQAGWDETLATAHTRFAAGFEGYNGYTTASYLQAEQAHIDGLFKGAGVWMRTSAAGLQKILTDGRVKSAFETHTTGAPPQNMRQYLSLRAGVEQTLFGYPTNLPAAQRPIYGYVTKDGNGAQSVFLSQFGQVAVHFDDSVRTNTTVTAGDSADESGALQENPRLAPVPINSPDYRAFSSGMSPLNATLETGMYTEAQIHGGAATREHISEVVFRDRAPSPEQIALLNQYHIAYRQSGGGA